MIADLRLGRWQDVLSDVGECDVLLSDAPYSERTHEGERGMRLPTASAKCPGGTVAPRNAITYAAITPDDVRAFVASWAPRVRHWALVFGDHQSFVRWEAAWAAAGWVTFAPVLWLKRGAPPRFAGDGPASWAEYLCIARPRRRVRDSGSRPGWYEVVCECGRAGHATGVVGTKDVSGLRRILADYTRPGDVVADPFAGTATVGHACVETGRRYVGSECDPRTYQIGRDRLHRAQPCIPGMEPDRWRDTAGQDTQQTMFGNDARSDHD
jgi:hypothetical protein